MNKAMGIGLILMALVIAIVPVFTDCQSQGRSLTTQDGKSVPMKCHWTGIAEIGVALRRTEKDAGNPSGVPFRWSLRVCS